jgi:hypothetical protein
MRKCHLCPVEFSTEEELRIHLLFTHQFFKQDCEINRVLIDWEHKQFVKKTRAWHRGIAKSRTNRMVPLRWLQFWDSVEGTDNYYKLYRQQRTSYERKYYSNPKVKERRRQYSIDHKEQISKRQKELYLENKKNPEWILKKKLARKYIKQTDKEKVSCSLCGMEFVTSDPLFSQRKRRHTKFHSTARVQGRNTTQGKPKYE